MFLAFRSMCSVRCTAGHGCLDFLSQRFSSYGRDDASLFYKRKSQEKHFSHRRIFSDFPARVNERECFWPSAPCARFGAQPGTAVWIFSPSGFHRMVATTPVCSIKGKVKKNTSPTAGYFLTFQPVCMSENVSGLPIHVLGSVHRVERLF